MSKRRKTQVSEENKEEGISKPKENSRKKIHLTRESDPEKLIHSLSIPEVYEECKENLEEDQELSSAKLLKDYSECKELDYTKVAMPSSQNRKLVPTFTKSKKPLIKRQEKCFEETTTANCTKEDQHVDENVSRTANTVQNLIASAESSVTKTESAGDQIIPHCDGINERLVIKIQDKCGIRELNNNDVRFSARLLDSQPEAGIEPNSQASSHEEEMSQKPVSFSLRGSGNNDANSSENEALSLEPLTCQLAKQMNVSKLPEDEIVDPIQNCRNEEEGLDNPGINVQQDKPMQIILEADKTNKTEPRGIINGNGKDSRRDSECMDSLTQRVTNGIQLPVIADIFIPTPGKWNHSPCTTQCANQQGNADVKETEGLPDKSGKTEEQNDNCACSNSEISAPGASKSVGIKKESDLETNGKPVEKGIDSGRKDSIPAEQNSIKNESIPGKGFPYVQPVDPCLEKEADHSEPICDQIILKDGQIASPLNGDVLPESKNISLEDAVCVKERIYNNSTEANVPTPLIQKENAICSEPLGLNIQQSELGENHLMIDNIMSALPSSNVAEKTVKISKAAPKSGENVLFPDDLYTANEEAACCEGNGSTSGQVERNFPSVEILPPQVLGDPNKGVNVQSKMQCSSAASGPDPSLGAPNDLGTVAQAYSPCPDSFSLDLESLPDTPWEGILKSQGVEFQSQKACVLNDLQTCFKAKSNQPATRERGGNKTPPPASPGTYANNVRGEVKMICDPSKQEDATEVVYGLIKELSNLNRLTMSTHRDLDSFKRLQARRNKPHGRLLSHGMNNMTSTVCGVKKKREL